MEVDDELESDEEQSALMHNRAREAGSELRRAVITLSTGSIAMLFLALTAEIKPPLDILEKVCATGTILAHAIATLFGLCAWRADAKRNFHWAHSLSSKQDQEGKKQNETKRKIQQSKMKVADKTSHIFFVAGVILATIYLIDRTI